MNRISATLRRLVNQRAKGLCEYCLIHENDTFLGCQFEHIISKKHGGPTNQANLALACVFCNQAKGTDIATIARSTGRISRLYNPRTDLWAEHFRFDGTRIIGLTEIGEATAALLAFNHPDRILEREELVKAGRYPSAAARARMRQ
jgi:hypothetical protein